MDVLVMGTQTATSLNLQPCNLGSTLSSTSHSVLSLPGNLQRWYTKWSTVWCRSIFRMANTNGIMDTSRRSKEIQMVATTSFLSWRFSSLPYSLNNDMATIITKTLKHNKVAGIDNSLNTFIPFFSLEVYLRYHTYLLFTYYRINNATYNE